MRKLLSIGLSIVIVFSLAFPMVFAQNAVLKLELSEEIVYEEWDFQVAVRLESVNNLIGAGFDLHYPVDAIKYQKTEQGPFLAEDNALILMPYNVRESEGIINFGISRAGDVDGVSGSGILVVFHFTALKQVEEASIDLKNLMLLDPASMEIKVDFEPLSFEIHELDTTPPPIEIDEIKPTYYNATVITGKTDPTASLTINDEPIEIDDEGNFSLQVELEVGDNKFTIVATSRARIENMVELIIVRKEPVVLKLQIGNKTVYINDKAVEIEAAPFVDAASSRTLVPIRIVTESIGAGIEWEGTEQKITINHHNNTIELWIGRPIAHINGIMTPIDIDAPTLSPRIVAGRTVLPLRFVADNLGFEVGWEGTTQTITLTYPKPS